MRRLAYRSSLVLEGYRGYPSGALGQNRMGALCWQLLGLLLSTHHALAAAPPVIPGANLVGFGFDAVTGESAGQVRARLSFTP
jgi:hypothetical protein